MLNMALNEKHGVVLSSDRQPWSVPVVINWTVNQTYSGFEGHNSESKSSGFSALGGT